jgi:hypothetical protein
MVIVGVFVRVPAGVSVAVGVFVAVIKSVLVGVGGQVIGQ